ncbi:MAG TPA: serine hydrolase domain-containing protein [Chloroflexota bacterium]|nr:serine hydrolase domain-containing protein [Chloroflexota bacterium]
MAPIAEEAMARLGVPGVGVGILHGDQEYAAGFGVTNVRHPLPVDAETLFRVVSVTKVVTATAALRLVEQGRLALDAPLRAYAPELRVESEEVSARLTLRHVLTHTGGFLSDFPRDVERTWDFHGERALAQCLADAHHLRQITPPGQVWFYNSAGFDLLGRIVEKVTGLTFDAAVAELVLQPLGMQRSVFMLDRAIPQRCAIGHETREGKPVPVDNWGWPRSHGPAAGLIASPRDLLRFARFHLGDGTTPSGDRLLGTTLLREMHAPLVSAGGMCDACGMGWWVWDVGGTRVIGHSGYSNRERATLRLVPARDFAICVLANGDRGDLLHAEITAWALRHFLGVSEPDRAPLALTRAHQQDYAGRYLPATGIPGVSPGELIVEPHGATARIRAAAHPAAAPLELAFYAPDRAQVAGGAPGFRAEFVRDATGAVAWLRLRGRILTRLR